MHRRVTCSGACVAALLAAPAATQGQLEMFPPGPFVSHCRGIQDDINTGGDDDHNNIYFFVVDAAVADGTAAPDFFIHLWDGDNNSQRSQTGTGDYDPNARGRAVFEYRLYGGPGALLSDEVAPGMDPASWSGTLIDIDPDPGDDTLRTDDPDDLDGDQPEDLRNLDFSLIGVDMDANPGGAFGATRVYKFVVDGAVGASGGDWNRYEIQVSRDPGRTDNRGVRLLVYELTYAGRPGSSAVFTRFPFLVPITADQRIDIQTLDIDYGDGSGRRSQLTTATRFFSDAECYESDEQYEGGAWRWTSLNQQVNRPNGDGVTGAFYDTAGQAGSTWFLDVDPATATNPFSIRITNSAGQLLPIEVLPARLGQPNTAAASLLVNTVGAGSEPGPYLVGIQSNDTMRLDFAGPADQPFVLFLGQRLASGLSLGCSGQLDVGGALAPILDGTVSPFFRLRSDGTARIDITLPTLLAGSSIDLQAIVLQPVGAACPGFVLTAAHFVTVF